MARSRGSCAALTLCGLGAVAATLTAQGRPEPARPPGGPVPLCAGLTIVTAVNEPAGDYESIKTITSVSAEAVRLTYSSERMAGDMFSPGPPVVQTTTLTRTIRRQDLQTATTYAQEFSDQLPESIPGTTAIGVSRAVLDAMKRGVAVEFGISSTVPGQALGIDPDVRPNIYDYLQAAPLTRVAPAPVHLPVVVNNVPVTLPAIHAVRDAYGERSEFFVLDDPANPLMLQFRIGIDAVKPWGPEMREMMKGVTALDAGIPAMFGMGNNPDGGDKARLRVVKITNRCGDPAMPAAGGGGGVGAGVGAGPGPASGAGASALERSLATTGRADVYDIFFSFNSDRLRPESEPTLREIAALLRTRADWSLSIEGHTDGIASDTFNLELSRRRAASVKAALVSRHGVSAARLASAGFGESRPRDSNDTLDGRARNRRVELVRTP